jgi:hypothetical protein
MRSKRFYAGLGRTVGALEKAPLWGCCHCLAGSQTRYAPHRWLAGLAGLAVVAEFAAHAGLAGRAGRAGRAGLAGLARVAAETDARSAGLAGLAGLQHDVQKKWQS